MFTNFVIGMVGSLIVAVLYGFFISQREEQIRQYLSAQRKGWVRKRYVRAFVGAVRGRAAALNTSLLAILILLIPFVFYIVSWSEASQLEQRIYAINNNHQKLDSILGGTYKPDIESAKNDFIALAKEWKDIKIKSSRIIVALRTSGVLSLIVFYMALFFWRPFVVMRQRFAYEIDRFTLRIQGLASKAELAEIAVAEAAVVDEETLRHFVKIMHDVASRHGIPQLVTTFDLWKDDRSNE